MYDSDSDYVVDENSHNQLVNDICYLHATKDTKLKNNFSVNLKKSLEKVEVTDLLNSIKSTRNVDLLKKTLINDEIEKPKKTDKKKILKKRTKVLEAPLHKQAKERVESKLVYKEVKKDLHQWNTIVHSNRVAEQVFFPLDADPNFFYINESGADKSREFEPKTELEKLTAEVLGKSKFNLNNKDAYCEAEKEVIKAMSLKNARRKCQELQKMRALMSYKAIKMKQQAKIKSKKFHRIKKREERRKIMKEIEKLIVKDPEAVREKIDCLEKDRTYERATLKHRGVSKWSRQMRQYALKNPEIKKILDEHYRFGKEMKSKNNNLNSINETDESNDECDKNLSLSNQDEVNNDSSNVQNSNLPIISVDNPFLKSALEAIRIERQTLLEEAKLRGNIDTKQKINENNAIEEKPLVLKSAQLINLPEDLTNGLNEYNTEMQDNFLAEAYEEDDVLGEFEKEKERVEKEEEPKIIDLNLNGWGSWTGPGIVDKKKEKFIIRPKKLNRKDRGKSNLIIREKISKGINELQPREVPFPFTRMEDFEAYIRQPLGRDWNSEQSQKLLVKPRIVTKAGAIIRPLDKTEKERLDFSDSD